MGASIAILRRATTLFAAAAALVAPAAASGAEFSTTHMNAHGIPDGEGKRVILLDLRQFEPDPLTDVNARVRVDHPRTRDLKIRLEGPGDISVKLSSRSTRGADLGTDECHPPGGFPAPPPTDFTVFDDEAGTAIGDGTAPYSGAFRPVGSLTAFDGRDWTNRWRLVFKDVKEGRHGRIRCAGLQITH